MKEFIIDSENFTDIKPLYAGVQTCKPCHSYGPFVRQQYLIHFCLSGKGSLTDPRGSYTVSEGELFIIRPGEVTVYTADRDEPWEYMWLGFEGTLAEVFRGSVAVYPYSETVKMLLGKAIADGNPDPHVYSSVLHLLISEIFEPKKELSDAATAVKDYIDYNYMCDIKVGDVAGRFGFERSYLFRVFKARYGIGIKEYIIKARMENAVQLLSEGHPVGITASAVGYRDEFAFSRAFKKYYGASPRYYKSRNIMH